MSGQEDLRLRKKLESHLDDLPVLPTAVARLMMLSADADDDADQVTAGPARLA